MSESELREQLSLQSFGKVRKLYKRTRERFGLAGPAGSAAHAIASTPASEPSSAQPLFKPSESSLGISRMPSLSPGIPTMSALAMTPGPACEGPIHGSIGAIAEVRRVDKDANPKLEGPGLLTAVCGQAANAPLADPGSRTKAETDEDDPAMPSNRTPSDPVMAQSAGEGRIEE